MHSATETFYQAPVLPNVWASPNTKLATWLTFPAALLLLLYLSTHGYVPVLMSSGSDNGSNSSSNFVNQLSQVLFCIVLTCITIPVSKKLFRIAQSTPSLVLLVSLTLLSALWSQDPGLTVHRSLMLVFPTLLAFVIHIRFGFAQQLRLFLALALLVGVISIIFSLAMPAYGVDHESHEGAWQGIFYQKNICARACVFLMAAPLCLLCRKGGSKRMSALAFALLAMLLVMTQSRTGIAFAVVLLVAIPLFGAFRRLRSKTRLLVMVGISTSLLASIAILATGFGQITSMLGRDATLTGRTAIWQGAVEALSKHPLLGYGFSAFWMGLKGESANIVLAARWLVPAAHNGYLDVWLQLGAVGLLLFAISLYSITKASWSALKGSDEPMARWCAAIVFLTVIYNFDETSLMISGEILWVLYVLAFLNLQNLARRSPTTAN